VPVFFEGNEEGIYVPLFELLSSSISLKSSGMSSGSTIIFATTPLGLSFRRYPG